MTMFCAEWTSEDPLVPLQMYFTVESHRAGWRWGLSVGEIESSILGFYRSQALASWPRLAAGECLNAALYVIAQYSAHKAMALRRVWKVTN
jgi:hypothetical protein